jgi:hypothetical protein
LASAVVFVGAGASEAATGTASVVGNGTISPGLTATPTAQNVTFSGTAVVAATAGSGVYHCNFNGASDIGETIQAGDGNVSGNCTSSVPAGNSFVCNSIHYQRTGGVVRINGSCTGTASGTITGAFSFEPTSVAPISSYQLQGTVAIT